MQRHTTVSVWWHMKKPSDILMITTLMICTLVKINIVVVFSLISHNNHMCSHSSILFCLPHKQKRQSDTIEDRKIMLKKLQECLYSITYHHAYLCNNESHDDYDVLFVSCELNEECWMVVNPPFFACFFLSFFLSTYVSLVLLSTKSSQK